MASRRNAKAFDDAPRAKLDKATLRKAMRVFRYLRRYLGNIDSVALLLLGVFALQAVLGFGRIYLFAYVTEHMLARLRQDTYEHLLKLPMHFFATRRVGELNSRISADVALCCRTPSPPRSRNWCARWSS
jgi:hypothetical protein